MFSVRYELNFMYYLDLPKVSNNEVWQGHNVILYCTLLLRNFLTRSYHTWKTKPCFCESRFVYRSQLWDSSKLAKFIPDYYIVIHHIPYI